MRYFHRTSVAPADVLAEADQFLASRLETSDRGERNRAFRGPVGTISLTVRAEGGHHTLVTVETDQVGESEADKLAKQFLGRVHTLAEPSHQLRGAY